VVVETVGVTGMEDILGVSRMSVEDCIQDLRNDEPVAQTKFGFKKKIIFLLHIGAN